MAKREKLLESIRNNVRGARFSDLQRLLNQFGFALQRISGSHHIYRHPSGRMCNIQEEAGGMAKAYQVEQVLEAIDAAR
jgi:predicted RNA binding protein YcfA (HicA-like mRNA interferase family)